MAQKTIKDFKRMKFFNKKIFFKTSVIIFSFAFLSLSYQNCSKYNSQSLMSAHQSPLEILQSQSSGILTAKCLSCHNSDNKQGGVNVADLNEMLANGVVNVEEPDLSFLLQAVKAGTMPPTKPLTQSEIVTLNDWVNGLKAQPPSIAPPPVNQPLMPTFASIQQKILQPKCLGCHGAAGGFSYADYQSTLKSVVAGNAVASKFYQSVLNNQMPKNNVALSSAEKTAILNWINSGALNN